VDGAGAPIREYAFYPGVDQPHSVRRVSDGAEFYYTGESPGHVTGLVSSAEQMANEYQYTPWGEALQASESVEQPLRYMAREYDSESGLYYVRARYYDPELARFNSEDPIGLAGGINPYVYAGNDPVNNTDPLGLYPKTRRIQFPLFPQRNRYHPGALIDEIPNEDLLVELGVGAPSIAEPEFSYCPAVPESPSGVSLRRNIRIAELHRLDPAREAWFYLTVRNGGPWDYKQRGDQYQAFGNFNYGATGAAAGFPDVILLRAAGAAQVRAGTSSPEWGTPSGGPPYGDDPEDQKFIMQGITYYKNRCFRRW
jgi:RHS repeat-associated protein